MITLLRRRLLWPMGALFAVLGPAFITATVDQDPPGIATYSVAGAEFGYSVLWLLWFVVVLGAVMQEVAARLGVATSKGLVDLIREHFGVKVTALLMLGLLITNYANTAGQFAGLAEAAEIFGISRFFAVPVGAAAIWLLVVSGSYRGVERIFLLACLVYLAYPISGYLAEPDWGEVARQSVLPSITVDRAFMLVAVGIVGASLAPWMQFFLQSAIVERGVKPEEYGRVRLDVIAGAVFAMAIVFFIIVACAATLHREGRTISSAAEAAEALRPLAGRHASTLFGVGLINAGLFAATVLPLTTAYVVCEGLGWERGLGRGFRAAPHFYGLYTGMIVLGAAVILIPGAPLLGILLASQVMNGLLLPAVLILMLLLAGRSGLMGELAHGRRYGIFCWGLCGIVIVLDVVLLATAFMPGG